MIRYLSGESQMTPSNRKNADATDQERKPESRLGQTGSAASGVSGRRHLLAIYDNVI